MDANHPEHYHREPAPGSIVDEPDLSDQAAMPHAAPPIRRWVSFLAACGVSVSIGLAPLLGTLHVPLFSPLLSILPDVLRGPLITFTSALMGLAAVLVQWFSEEQFDRRARGRALVGSLTIAVLGLCAFYIIATFVVCQVDFGGQRARERGIFLIGFQRPTKPPCTADISNEDCIRLLSLDQARINSFWGNLRINVAKLALSGTYLVFMLGFAAAVGIVVHRREL